MPQLSTLKHVADIVVSRILADAAQYKDVAAALEEAYPFGDDPIERQVWMDALLRHAFSLPEPKKDGGSLPENTTIESEEEESE